MGAQLCKDLCRMIPVQGKCHSLSLRTSSFLIHGISIAHRVKVEALLGRCTMLRSRMVTKPKLDGSINLPERLCAPNLMIIPEMLENDIGRLEELDVDVAGIDVMDFRARANDITLREVDSRMEFEFIGPDLPRLTEEDILGLGGLFDMSEGEKVDCDHNHNVDAVQGVESEQQFDDLNRQEETAQRISKEVMPMTPIKARVPSGTEMTDITPSVSDSKKRQTVGTCLDMDDVSISEQASNMDVEHQAAQVEAGTSLLLEANDSLVVEVDNSQLVEANSPQHPPPNIKLNAPGDDCSPDIRWDKEPSPNTSNLELLPINENLVPQKKRKKLVRGPIIDVDTQLNSADIKNGILHYGDTMRCDTTLKDRFRQGERRLLDFGCSGRRLGGTLELSFKRAVLLNGCNKDDESESYDEIERDITEVQSMKDGNSYLDGDVRESFSSMNSAPVVVSSSVQANVTVDHLGERQLGCIEEEIHVIHDDVDKLPFNAEACNIDPSHGEKEEEASIVEHEVPLANDLVPGIQDEVSLDPSYIAVEVVPGFQENASIDPSSRADDVAHETGQGSLTLENRIEHTDSLINNASDTFGFGDLCPVESTSRLCSSQMFYRLLQLEKEGKVVSAQDVTYGPLMYSKK